MEFSFCGRGVRFVLALSLVAISAAAQTSQSLPPSASETVAYIDAASGVSSNDLVRRALSANRDLAAAQLSVERARGRLTQAGLLPNPSLDVERARGTGESTDADTAIGFAMPIELGGKRSSRIALAQAELRAAEAEFRDRQRRLVADVLAAYIDALSALRELDVTAKLNDLDVETGKYVQTRVNEGDAPPLEMKLLRVEIERLRARRILLRGQVEAALLRLRQLTGISVEEPLRFRQEFSADTATGIPASAAEAVSFALRSRPDLELAKLNEAAAEAALRAVRAQTFPDITAFTKYERERSNIEESPIGAIGDPDRHISLGFSISLPFFNRNQGLRAEAQAGIEQARRQREFTESIVRAEVESAYRRLRAAEEALAAYQSGVIDLSTENIGVMQAAYKLGEFRITDLIAERRRFVDSQREFTELLAERQRALTDLQIAMGNFTPEEKS